MASLNFSRPVRTIGLPVSVMAPLQRPIAIQRRAVDEDGARRALGVDLQMPAAVVAGASLEHLARIALG